MKKAIDGNKIVFTFTGLEPIVFNANLAHDDTRAHAMMHGFAARIGDNAAIQKTELNNYTVTEQMRRDAVSELVHHYESNSPNWNVRAAGAAPKQNPVIAAIAAKRNITYAEAEKFLADQFLSEIGE